MLDLDKPVQTGNGRKARIICKDKKGLYPIVALVENPHYENLETVVLYGENGVASFGQFALRLINVPVKHTRWLNVYSGGQTGSLHPSKKEADINAGSARLNCIKVEWEE